MARTARAATLLLPPLLLLLSALPTTHSYSSLPLLRKLYSAHRTAAARRPPTHNTTTPPTPRPAAAASPPPPPAAHTRDPQGVVVQGGGAGGGGFAKRAAASTAALVLWGHACFDAGTSAPPKATPAHQALILKRSTHESTQKNQKFAQNTPLGRALARGGGVQTRKEGTAFILSGVRESTAVLLQDLMYSTAAVAAARATALALTLSTTVLMLLSTMRAERVRVGAKGAINSGLLWLFDLFSLSGGAGGAGVQRIYLQTAREKIFELEMENTRLRTQLAQTASASSSIRDILGDWKRADGALPASKPRPDEPGQPPLGIFSP